ncbi:MAG: sialidase family protein [Planctomycetota bacterium]
MQNAAADSPSGTLERQTLFAPHQRNGREIRYRCPNLLVSARGTVFAFPSEKVAGIADETKANFVLRRSVDDGRTWGEREALRAEDNPRVTCGYAASVADAETGRVCVFFRQGVVILPEDIDGAWPERWRAEHPDEAAALCRKLAPEVDPGLYLISTDDEGETWSEPVPLGNTLHPINPVTGEQRPFGPQWVGVQLRHGPHEGRLVLPGRGLSKGAPFDLFAYAHNYVIFSDDHGATWQAGGWTQTGTGEACLAETADGVLYVSSRNESLRLRGFRAWDRSYDGGETFPESGYDPALPEPHCQASMVRFDDPAGTHSGILFCNPAVPSETPSHYDHEKRRRLTVRLSRDGCRTWPIGRVVEPGSAGYSALAVAADGAILCAYETLTETSYSGTIELARFDIDWLTGQAETSDDH